MKTPLVTFIVIRPAAGHPVVGKTNEPVDRDKQRAAKEPEATRG